MANNLRKSLQVEAMISGTIIEQTKYLSIFAFVLVPLGDFKSNFLSVKKLIKKI